MFIKRIKIGKHERGLRFVDREFRDVLQPGTYWLRDLCNKINVRTVSVRDPWLTHPELDVMAKSGQLGDDVRVIDLRDSERALVWIDGRFDRVIGPGLHGLWTVFRDISVEVFDARDVRFEHASMPVILKSPDAGQWLNKHEVPGGHVGLYFYDGEFRARLDAGVHAFWANTGKVRIEQVDMRESVIDVVGQEIMTADKVTLRLNSVVVYRVVDPLKAVQEVEDRRQALYREAQLALRAVIGTRDLDALLARKDEVATELEAAIAARAAAFGLTVVALGIRDLILPGEMKDLLNKVTEARKAAEAALVTRREETAAMRSQANTARLLDANPTLMRLRELEVLERVAEKTSLQVMLGEDGLANRVMKLL